MRSEERLLRLRRRKQRWWSPDELELLRREARHAPSQNELARRMAPRLGRTFASVRIAIQDYGIQATGPQSGMQRGPRPWTPREIDIVYSEMARVPTLLEAARRAGTTLGRRTLAVLKMMESLVQRVG